MKRLVMALVQGVCLFSLILGCAGEEPQKIGRPKRPGQGGGAGKPGRPQNILSNFSLVDVNSIPTQLAILDWIQSLPATDKGACWSKESGTININCPLDRKRGLGLAGSLNVSGDTTVNVRGSLELKFYYNGNLVRSATVKLNITKSPLAMEGGKERFALAFEQEVIGAVRSNGERTIDIHGSSVVEHFENELAITQYQSQTTRVATRIRKGQPSPPGPIRYYVKNRSPISVGTCFMPTGTFHIEGDVQTQMDFGSEAGKTVYSKGGNRPAQYKWPLCKGETELFPFQIWVQMFNQGSF